VSIFQKPEVVEQIDFHMNQYSGVKIAIQLISLLTRFGPMPTDEINTLEMNKNLITVMSGGLLTFIALASPCRNSSRNTIIERVI